MFANTLLRNIPIIRIIPIPQYCQGVVNPISPRPFVNMVIVTAESNANPGCPLPPLKLMPPMAADAKFFAIRKMGLCLEKYYSQLYRRAKRANTLQ